MNYVVSEVDGVRIIQIEENLTFVNQREFTELIKATVDSGATQVILDISKMSFIGSLGIGLIAQFYNKMKETSAKLSIVRPAEEICRVFSLTGLDRVIPFHQTLEEALAAFGRDAKDIQVLIEGTADTFESKIERLANESAEVRRYVAWSLGLLGNSQAIPHLEKALKDDPAEEVREAAADSLKKLTGRDYSWKK